MTTLNLTVDEALAIADQWCAGLTMNADSKGWGAILLVLAEEVRRLRMELAHEEQRVADMMADVNRVGHEIERLRAELEPAEAAFEVVDDDAGAETQCAYITGPREQALREAMHYAAVYSKDGPVKVREVIRRDIPMEANND